MLFFHRLSKRFILYSSACILFLTLAISLTPITAPLPPYTGQYEVGILDLETEVERRVVWDAMLKETGQPAFELQTLALNLYYPTSPLPNPEPWARPWLPQPISLIGRGYARLIGIHFAPLQSVITFFLWAFGSGTVIPGVVDAPMLNETVLDLGRLVSQGMKSHGNERVLELRDDDEDRERRGNEGLWPCVVFTHGMAGMSQSYSHYLGSIASHGHVVAAIEHRDGSGPGTVVHYPNATDRYVWHMKLEDLESDPPMTIDDLKQAQLAFRQAEIEETISIFQRLHAGHGHQMINLKPDSPGTTLPGFANRLNMSAVTVAGHSYGATGALQAMKNAPSKNMPVNGAIVLDPGKGSGPLNKDVDVPLLVMHSGQWTNKEVEFYGQGWHFDVVRKLVERTRKGWFMTLTGSAHPSCTDAPLIVPWIMKLATGTTLRPKVALREYITASVEFLEYLRHGERRGVLDSEVTSPEGPLGGDGERGLIKGKHGAEWEVHVVPEL